MTHSFPIDLKPFEPHCRIGTVSKVFPDTVIVNLEAYTQKSGRLLSGKALSGGSVGDFIVLDCNTHCLLGRILDIQIPDKERLDVEPQFGETITPHPFARVHLLAGVNNGNGRFESGISIYPHLGASAFAANSEVVARFATAFGIDESSSNSARIHLGHVRDAGKTPVTLDPKRLFSRHCAVLGTTGGGKSTTVARLVHGLCTSGSRAKVILFDPVGEYRPMDRRWRRIDLSADPSTTKEIENVGIPFSSLSEGDFYALFAPSGKVQGPKLREAIRSLRLVRLIETRSDLQSKYKGVVIESGTLRKVNHLRSDFLKATSALATDLEAPNTEFNLQKLAEQIGHECVYPTLSQNDSTKWGGYDGATYGFCLPLVVRINALTRSPEMRILFETTNASIFDCIEKFYESDEKVLQIGLEHISSDFQAREIFMNLIGRWLLSSARAGKFRGRYPLLTILDEAHNFLNKHIGDEDSRIRLDAFEKIAKEGRKFWLNLLLATQQPRDIPAGVLSQMGTLIVHRLINEADRKVVETACGQLDVAAAKFLPSLVPGEAAFIGVDFPIPLTVQIALPEERFRPDSPGPDYDVIADSKASSCRSSRKSKPRKRKLKPAIPNNSNVLFKDLDGSS